MIYLFLLFYWTICSSIQESSSEGSSEPASNLFHYSNYFMVKYGKSTTCTENTQAGGCAKLSTIINKLPTPSQPVPTIGVSGGYYQTSEISTTVSTSVSILGYDDPNQSDNDQLVSRFVLNGNGLVLEDPSNGESEIQLMLLYIICFHGTFIKSSASHVMIAGCMLMGSNRLPTQYQPLTDPIISLTAGSLLIDGLNGGAFRLDNVPVIKVASGCSVECGHVDFGDITRTNGNGAFLEGTLAADCSFSISAKFDHCSTAGNGGALAITVTGAGSLECLSSFAECTAAGNGGGMYIDIQSDTLPTMKFFEVNAKSLTFDGDCKASNGNGLHIKSKSDLSSQTSFWSLFGSFSMFDVLAVTVEFGSTTMSAFTGLSGTSLGTTAPIPESVSTNYVLAKGAHAQQTTNVAISDTSLIRGETVSPSDTTIPVSFPAGASLFSVSGTAVFASLTFNLPTSGTVEADSAVFGSSDGGSLTLSFAVVSGGASPIASPSPVVSMSDGSLFIFHTTFANITLTATPLIQTASSTTIGISGQSLFENITRQAGDGSVLSLSAGTFSQAEIFSTTFRKCKTGGNGGALYATVDYSNLRLGCNYQLKEVYSTELVTFEECVADNTNPEQRRNANTAKGGAIYIQCTQSYQQDYPFIREVSFSQNSASAGYDMYVEVTNTEYYDDYYPYSLNFFSKIISTNSPTIPSIVVKTDTENSLLTIPASISVDSSSNDASAVCTTCKTLHSAIHSHAGAPPTITIDSHTLTEEVPTEIERTLVINGLKPSGTTIEANLSPEQPYEGRGFLGIDGENIEVTFNNLNLKCTGEQAIYLLLVMSEDADVYTSAVLNDVSIEPAEAEGSLSLSKELIYALFGKLSMNRVNISRFTTARTPLLSACPYKDYFALNSVEFSKITRTYGGGSVLALAVGYACEVKITSATFSECTCPSGDGGAINIITLPSSSIQLKKCTFKHCTAGLVKASARQSMVNGEGNKGGAIFLDFQGVPEAVTLDEITAEGCSASEENGGNVLCVEFTQETKPANSFWSAAAAGLSGVEKGDFIAGQVDETGEAVSEGQIDLNDVPRDDGNGEAENKNPSSDDGLPAWAIVLIVVGSVIIVAVVVVIIIILCLRKKGTFKGSNKVEPSTDEANPAESTQPEVPAGAGEEAQK